MPQEHDLDQRPYFQLLHAMLREDGTDAEIDRTSRVMEWVLRTRHTIDRVCDRTEMQLIGILWEQFNLNKKTPTRDTMTMLIKSGQKPKALLDLLANYDKFVPDLKKLTHADMDVYLQVRTAEFEQNRLIRILENAKHIVTGGLVNPDNRKGKEQLPDLVGTRDSMNYLMKKFQSGILVNDVRADGGLLSDFKDRIQVAYDKNKVAQLNGQLFIPTGIPLIDEHMGGLRRKELTGILGFVGQRKTAVLRTMGYNAAKAGFRVLHIPLESDFEDELTAYNLIHAHSGQYQGVGKLTRRRYDAGELTDEEYNEFMSKIVDDFAEKVGNNLIVYDPKASRTWSDICAVIERENYINPLDLVLIDYLTLLGDPTARDAMAAKILMIQDAKQLTLNTGDRGFAMVTPIQGNRKGYDEAQANDGAWETTGIHQYSELDKSLDNCLYVFTNDEISASGQIKMGSCKYRRGPNIPSTFVPINLSAGMVAPVEYEQIADASDQSALPQPPSSDDVFFDWMEPK
jgi:hypothetical protein